MIEAKDMLRLEKTLKRFLWLLPVFCLSCAERDLVDGMGTTTGGMAQITLDINAPAIASSVMTRAISSENESSLDGTFAVFAFNDNDLLMWTLQTGAVNGTATNLQGEDGYDDNTDTPSLTWHAAEGESTGGRLYLEAPEYVGEVTLLVLANVDLTEVAELDLTAGTSTKADVVSALSALDYDATDESLNYIPMSAETTVDGIMLGTTGTVQLRRSLAKFSVTFLWDDAYYDDEDLQSAGAGGGVTDLNSTFNYKCFVPDTVYIESVNTYATVYSSSTTLPNVSTNANQTTTELSFDVSTPEYDQQSNAFSTELEFYVPETVNTGNPAYNNGDLADDPRVSILVHGTYYETDGTTMDDCWYRFDLIPAEGSTDELEYVLRNNHYHFTLRNVSKRGSTEKALALGLTMPDNYRNDNDVDAVLTVIEDDDIVSVTMDYYNTVSEDGEQTDYQYYYIGVSSIYSEMPQTQDAVAGLKVVTNIAGGYMEDDGWTIDISALPTDDEGDCAFSFIYDAAAEKLWIWLDHPEAVEVGETYYYYIVAGNMRKKMRITITEGEYTADND